MDSGDGILFFVAVCDTKMNVVVYHFSSTVRNLFRFDSRNDMTRTSLLLTLSCHDVLLLRVLQCCCFRIREPAFSFTHLSYLTQRETD